MPVTLAAHACTDDEGCAVIGGEDADRTVGALCTRSERIRKGRLRRARTRSPQGQRIGRHGDVKMSRRRDGDGVQFGPSRAHNFDAAPLCVDIARILRPSRTLRGSGAAWAPARCSFI